MSFCSGIFIIATVVLCVITNVPAKRYISDKIIGPNEGKKHFNSVTTKFPNTNFKTVQAGIEDIVDYNDYGILKSFEKHNSHIYISENDLNDLTDAKSSKQIIEQNYKIDMPYDIASNYEIKTNAIKENNVNNDKLNDFQAFKQFLRSWYKDSAKKARKLCKKACKKAYKDVCNVYRCSKSMKGLFKRYCKEECDYAFYD